jgi:hypothetical protein
MAFSADGRLFVGILGGEPWELQASFDNQQVLAKDLRAPSPTWIGLPCCPSIPGQALWVDRAMNSRGER